MIWLNKLRVVKVQKLQNNNYHNHLEDQVCNVNQLLEVASKFIIQVSNPSNNSNTS